MTLRVGDMFLKIDADQTRTDVEAAPQPWTLAFTPGDLQLQTRRQSLDDHLLADNWTHRLSY